MRLASLTEEKIPSRDTWVRSFFLLPLLDGAGLTTLPLSHLTGQPITTTASLKVPYVV